MNQEELEIHAAKMRLREAGRRLERIRRLPKREYVDQVIYRTELANFWDQVTQDRLFLKSKGVTKWPEPATPKGEKNESNQQSSDPRD